MQRKRQRRKSMEPTLSTRGMSCCWAGKGKATEAVSAEWFHLNISALHFRVPPNLCPVVLLCFGECGVQLAQDTALCWSSTFAMQKLGGNFLPLIFEVVINCLKNPEHNCTSIELYLRGSLSWQGANLTRYFSPEDRDEFNPLIRDHDLCPQEPLGEQGGQSPPSPPLQNKGIISISSGSA